MADVSTPCAAYAAAAPSWKKIGDAVAGEDAIKRGREDYLPRPNHGDKSAANVARYDHYLKRAVWYGATGRTVEGLTGLAFQKDPKVIVPAGIDDVMQNVDGAGQTIVQQMHETLSQVLQTGRAGLLTDFPKTAGETSRADEAKRGIRPTITFYDALSAINWRTKVVGGQAKLSLLVLREMHLTFDDFEEKSEEQYRVLRLDGGEYTVEIWRAQIVNGVKKFVVVEPQFAPVDGKGAKLDEIPFTFVGSKNNSTAVNKAPMLDIATLNIAHYRNSADYEDSAFFCGQPQFFMAGLSKDWVDMLDKKGIYIGSRAILPLPTGGSAGILQAEPNTLAKEAMDSKEKQLAAMGARLIQADKSIKTATQQQSEDAVANSVLGLCVDNVSAAYVRAINWAGGFANVNGKIEVEIPRDFTEFTIAPEELNALMGAVQQGLMPKTDFWRRMRAAGAIDPNKKDEEIQEEIDANPPMGLGADDPSGSGASA